MIQDTSKTNKRETAAATIFSRMRTLSPRTRSALWRRETERNVTTKIFEFHCSANSSQLANEKVLIAGIECKQIKQQTLEKINMVNR